MANTTLSNDEILEAIGNMSVIELVELIDAFKTKFNVTIAAVRRRRAGRVPPPRPSRNRPSSRSSSRKPAPRRSRSSRSFAKSPAWA